MGKGKIIETISAIFNGADERNWGKVQKALAQNVWLDYSSLSGNPAATLPATQIIDGWKGVLPGFDKTHHQLSDFTVEQTDGTATAHFKGKADHFIGEEKWTVEATYDAELSKEGDEWRVTKPVLNLIQQSGNTELSLQAAKNISKAKKEEAFTSEKVTFESESETIVGRLLLPKNYQQGDKFPIFIIIGAWTQVKEQTQYFYGKKLATKGFAVLNFDPRFWGESGGEPRYYESTQEKVKDVLNAIKFLKSRPEIDTTKINLIGVCAGAGVMLRVAAQSRDVAHVATVAAWLQHPSTTPGFYGGKEGVNARIKLSDEAAQKYAATQEVDLVDAYNPDDPSAAMFFPLDYYSNPQRGAIPEWDNRFAVQSWKEWLTLNSIDNLADKITTPLIMVHSDDSALPENVKKFYEQVPGQNKKLVWTKGEHTLFYDTDEQVDGAIEAILQFFDLA